MNLKQLEYYLHAVDLKNITAASRKLHVAQPPISRQISLLEEEMGTQLLTRSNRGIETTETGQIVYAKAKEIFSTLAEMSEMVREADEGVRGEIRIGTIYSALPSFIEQFKYIHAHYPLIRLKIMHGDPRELMEQMEDGQIDVMFLRSPTCETSGYQYQILEEDNLALVIHREMDPAPDLPELEIEHLRDMPLCMLRSGNYWGYNEFLVDECHKHGFAPNIVCECHDTSVALTLVMEKLGASYQPCGIISLLAHPDIYIKPIRNFQTQTFPILMWKEGVYLSRPVRLFIALFQA